MMFLGSDRIDFKKLGKMPDATRNMRPGMSHTVTTYIPTEKDRIPLRTSAFVYPWKNIT
jgi:hypothetical protein